jgi:hypothetical protein
LTPEDRDAIFIFLKWYYDQAYVKMYGIPDKRKDEQKDFYFKQYEHTKIAVGM